MPGFVLEEPFPLARFHNTVGAADSKHFVVGLNSLESTLNNDSTERLDDADFVAITVQGEGFKIYNVNSFFFEPLKNENKISSINIS
jgi:hypothetical protein